MYSVQQRESTGNLQLYEKRTKEIDGGQWRGDVREEKGIWTRVVPTRKPKL